MKKSTILSVLLAGALSAGAARAGTIYNYGGPSDVMATNQSLSLSFNSASTLAGLNFTLDGYLSLDGQNYYEDDFTLSLNDTQIFSGTFNLGGGSGTMQAVAYSNPYNATFSNPTNNGTGIGWNGGQELFNFNNLQLQSGINKLTFSYTSVTDANHAGFQGLGDEGWGIEHLTVSNTSVPEPATWALMLGGLACLYGASSRLKPRQR